MTIRGMKSLWRYKDLLAYRVMIEARAETRQFYLGLSWWLIEPVVTLSVLYLVFGVILQRGGPGFAGFLLVGFVFFRWIDASIKRAMIALVTAKSVITQVRLPNWLFPVSDVLSHSLRFGIILLLLIGFTTWYSGSFGAAYVALVPLLLLNLAFIIGLGLCFSVLIPLFPDSRKIIDNLFSLLFFASGIFYDITQLDPKIASYLFINPIAGFISAYRQIMLENTIPSLELLRWPLLFTATFLVVAIVAYRKFGPRLAKALLR